MKPPIALALAFSLAWPAPAPTAVQPPPPPPPPDDVPQVRTAPEEFGYYQSCFGVPRPGYGPFAIQFETPIPIGVGGHSTSGISAPSLPSGSSDDKAWVVVAVVAAMALPVVVYAIDNAAPRIVLQRFACPTFSLDMFGGADDGGALGGGSQGFVSTRFMFGVNHVATDIQYDA